MGAFRNAFEVLAEACKSDTCLVDNINNDIDWSVVARSFSSLVELEEGVFAYDASAVPLVEAEIDGKRLFLVEMEALASYMKIAEIDNIQEAIENITNSNDEIESKDDVAVVVDDEDINELDDEDDFEEIEEACGKSTKKKNLKKKLKAALAIEEIKKNGNKVFKKKTKK